jgi:hypothetical protein
MSCSRHSLPPRRWIRSPIMWEWSLISYNSLTNVLPTFDDAILEDPDVWLLECCSWESTLNEFFIGVITWGTCEYLSTLNVHTNPKPVLRSVASIEHSFRRWSPIIRCLSLGNHIISNKNILLPTLTRPMFLIFYVRCLVLSTHTPMGWDSYNSFC